MPPVVRFVLRSVPLVGLGVAFGGIFAALLATPTQLRSLKPLQEPAITLALNERASTTVGGRLIKSQDEINVSLESVKDAKFHLPVDIRKRSAKNGKKKAKTKGGR